MSEFSRNREHEVGRTAERRETTLRQPEATTKLREWLALSRVGSELRVFANSKLNATSTGHHYQINLQTTERRIPNSQRTQMKRLEMAGTDTSRSRKPLVGVVDSRISLIESFQMLRLAVEKPVTALRLLLAILFVHALLLFYSAMVHSPTINEPGHLAAGLSNWKFARFDVYNVNPPLVRMLAALPVMAVGYQEDWSGFDDRPGARAEFGMGRDFILANGRRTLFILSLARWMCIPLSCIGGVVCFLWARDLWGQLSGITACCLWCCSPNILAHGALITADVGGASLGITACYSFKKWLEHPSWIGAAFSGLLLGLAELSKNTLVLLVPIWIFSWLIHTWHNRSQRTKRDWAESLTMLVSLLVIGIYVINVGYGFEGSLTPAGEFRFVSKLLGGDCISRETTLKRPAGDKQLQKEHGNRFEDSWLGRVPLPLPKNYVLGFDVQQRDFESYGQSAYLLGEWNDEGWWHYYLVATVIKTPTGTLVIGGIAICKLLADWRRTKMRTSDSTILFASPLLIFAVCSAKTGINEHFRYVLPCFPFAFILMSSVFAENTAARQVNLQGHSRVLAKLSPLLASVFLIWSAVSSLWIFPHSISYFNELIGGPKNGPKYLLGSNFDWGQDLKYLQIALESAPNISVSTLLYNGVCPPKTVGIEPKGTGSTSDHFSNGNRWIAISANVDFGRSFPCIGFNGQEPSARDFSIRQRPKILRKTCGYSIYLYQTSNTAHNGEPE